MDTLKANHARIHEIMTYMFPTGILRLPKLLQVNTYSIEAFDQKKPLWDEDVWSSLSEEARGNYIKLLKECLIILAKYDFFLKGVEVYLQTDGSLILTNLARVHHMRPKGGLVLESAKILPASVISRGFLQ
jgi:hypothetical protein